VKVAAVIPARMASSRFPGKPLASLLGFPMVLHVYERARRCKGLSEVVVATCDEEIRRVVEARGGRVIMTSHKHERGTDRVAEAATKIDADVVINVQGDEPLLDPVMLDEVSSPLVRDLSLLTCNLIQRLDTEEDRRSANIVKVVFTPAMKALYFSREPIPTHHYIVDFPTYRQLGIIAFTKDFLSAFTRMPSTPLERAESVDMMRALENGYSITLVETRSASYSVDTPADLETVVKHMEKDSLVRTYLPASVS
jgi:3-deoxy-manno-octulosonate cytidylyltransferase (CMP-KDO synthetase)